MGGPVPDERGGEGTILPGQGEPPVSRKGKKLKKRKKIFLYYLSD